MTKPLILITNDDGIQAPGIAALVNIARDLGELYIVAPDKPQSGMGHAITINSTLRIFPTHHHGVSHEFACSGTPVDCVKMAINHLMPRKPDLILSGINHGSNLAINVIYSGTMSAAVEGAVEGISSIGISLCDYSHEADFQSSASFVKHIIEQAILHPLPKGNCLNVNIPKLKKEEIMGIQVCRQAKSVWEEEFDMRTDPYGRDYFWLTGKFVNQEPASKDTDVYFLEKGYITIVPTQADLTAHQLIPSLQDHYDYAQKN